MSCTLGAPAVHAADPPAQSPAPPPAPEDLGSYLLAPGDTLRIAVWKEPELRADVFVRLDGRITVPLVGDVRAAGRTIEQLTAEVRQKLAAFLEAPTVTITLAQAVSARFYVIGEVTRPGVFQLTGRTTVLQALALAGGFREFAKRERIIILRKGGKNFHFNYKDVVKGKHAEQNILLEPGDQIIVN